MDQVRRAYLSDIGQLIEMGVEFATLSQGAHGFSVSRKRIIEFTNEIVRDANSVVLVIEKPDGTLGGVIAGVFNRIFFSEDIALQELVWYVKPGSKGIALLDALEDVARDCGAVRMIMGSKPAFYDLTKFYQRRGYRILENQFVREVCL